MNSNYRYQLERYRGRGTRYTCPQCGRKYTFTRYIDTENNNQYISDNVGKCNRLDKCGYHYTPRQYFTDNPHKRDNALVVDGSLRPFTDNPWKRERGVELWKNIGKFHNSTATNPPPRPICTLPEWVVERSLTNGAVSDHVLWLMNTYGEEEAERVAKMYGIGASMQGFVIFWQRDIEGRVRAGKIMDYDVVTGKRRKYAGAIGWIHTIMRREGELPEDWELTQCLYGEHLLKEHPASVVAVVEAYKTAHVGAILMPDMVWVATDSLQGLTAERLAPLRGRSVLFFPDEGKGYELWSERLPQISKEVGFKYQLSTFMEGKGDGADIADIVDMTDVTSVTDVTMGHTPLQRYSVTDAIENPIIPTVPTDILVSDEDEDYCPF